MKIKNVFFYFFLIILTLISRVSGLNLIKEEEKVLIAVTKFPPYIDEESDGNGSLIKLLDIIFREAGIIPEYKFYPWKRAQRFLDRGKVFAALPYVSTNWTKRSEGRYLISDEIMGCQIKLFYYKKSRMYFNFKGLEDLAHYKIGAVSGYLFFYNDVFGEIGAKDVFYSDEEESALKQLVSGKVDLVPYEELNGWQLIRNTYSEKEKELTTLSRTKTAIIKEKNFNVLDEALSVSNIRLLVSKDYPDSGDILKRFNNALNEIKKNGTYDLFIKNQNILIN